MSAPRDDARRGYASILAVYVAWGLMPAYWKLLKGIPQLAVLAHRAFWAFLIVGGVWLARRARARTAAPPAGGAAPVGSAAPAFRIGWKPAGLIALASLTLAIQWVAYLAAVTSNRLVEMSLGYYIFPLIAALLGRIFFGEKLDRPKMAALVLATAGVGILVARQGGVPTLALALAVSFSAYSLLKKRIKVNPTDATLLEFGFLLPFALAYIAWSEAGQGGWFLAFKPAEAALLAGGGVATAATLLLFATGARRIPMFALGFLQYISPTIVLALGVFAYGEKFDLTRAAAFGLIWLGVGAYSLPGLAAALKSASTKPDAAVRQSSSGPKAP